MASTFLGINIGKSGLYTYQSALNTTAHNAANAETTGYSRQIINIRASKPISVSSTYGMVGTGVTATGITQVRNNYYDVKYRSNCAISGSYSTKSYYSTQVENYFNEIENSGVLVNLENMSNSLQELSKDPSSITVKTQLTQYGVSLTEQVNYLATSLAKIQEEANTELKNSCDRINSLSQQIATLTKQINTVEVNGVVANDLRDTRNLLVDELSQYANISVSENVVNNDVGKTTYVVKLDGKTIVDTTEYVKLQVVPTETKNNVNDINGLYTLMWSDGQEFNNTSPTLGGSLQALYQVRDGNNGSVFTGKVETQTGNQITVTSENWNNELLLNIPESGTIRIGQNDIEYKSFSFTVDANGKYTYTFELEDSSATKNLVGEECSVGEVVKYKGIPYYMNKLNEFVRTMSKAFNEVHQTGQNANGTSGLDFFSAVNKVTGEDYVFNGANASSYYNMTAFNFSISQTIQNDPNNIATTSDIANGVENADIVYSLLNTLNDKTMFNQGSPESFFETLIADIAIDAKKVDTSATSQTTILDFIDTQRISVSGVDIDEEAMNIIRYQNAYNLSAKVVSVLDEVLDTLINVVGA